MADRLGYRWESTGQTDLNLRYLDQNGILVYGASTYVKNVEAIHDSEVIIAVGVDGS